MQGVKVMPVNELALSAIFVPLGMKWRFPSIDAARMHLRRYEKYFAQWGHDLGMHRVEVVAQTDSGDEKTWNVVPTDTGLKTEVTPIIGATQFEHDGDILIAQQWLNGALLNAIMEMRQSPDRIIALVNWESQKQVVMTAGCEELTLGDRLEDCIKYSRRDYWLPSDLDNFMRECRQNLRQDGSNYVEFRYHAFEPSTGDDWKLCVARYRMIDAGNLGLFQLGQNISFEHVAAPTAR